VADIEQALSNIGLASIRNITITASIYPSFNKRKSDSAFIMKLYWWHALVSAILARSIAEKTFYHAPAEAFLAGLLHDIGKLVLWTNFPDEYSRILTSAKKSPELILAGEIQLGASHSEVGAWLLKRWELPSFISDAILYHHEPFERIMDSLPLVKIVYTANIISTGMTLPDDGRFERANSIFGFDPDTVKDMVLKAEEEARQLAEMLDIRIETDERLEKIQHEQEQEKEERLAREVRDISLLQGTLQNLMEASDEDAILSVIRQGMRILFDVKNIYFFLYEPEGSMLIGRTVPGDSLGEYFREFTVPLQKKESILVKSLHRKTPMDSFVYSVRSMIIDEQIIHLIGTDGIVCLPMICRGDYVGVMVLGADETEVLHLFKRMRLLTMFTNQAAVAIHLDRIRKRQEALLQTERITAFSDMARKVNHEVNNPLGIIKNYLKILGMKLAKEDPVQHELVIINEEIDRISLIVSELSHFNTPRMRQIEKVDINSLLSDLTSITKKSLAPGNRITFHMNLDSSLPEIMTEKNSLKQAMINLIKNAIEAMPEGGSIFITTQHHSNTQKEPQRVDCIHGKTHIEIAIRDDGPGLPDSIKRRLYEPHTSTKGKGHFGLGLPLVYSTIMGLNGTIHCESTSEKGTSFRILLPLDEADRPHEETSR
jgi:nitrogen-specific signal transduction histidine kinase/HD-like signal output (HDOD) protein